MTSLLETGLGTLSGRTGSASVDRAVPCCSFLRRATPSSTLCQSGTKAGLIVRGKRDYLPKASIQDTVHVGFFKLRSRWDGDSALQCIVLRKRGQ